MSRSRPFGISRASARRLGRRARLAVESLENRTVLSFVGVQNFPIGGGPLAVAAGDVNNDGRTDLVAPAGAGGVSVLLGNGDGTFQAKKDSFANTGDQGWGLALGDFNGDGQLDAATSTAGGFLSVQLGKGDGTFGAPTKVAIGPDLRSVTAADFNGDGKLDLAAVSVGTDQKNFGTTVAILFGHGDGSFSAPTRVSVGNAPDFVTTADFNGDGKADIVTANFKDGTISELLGNGNGTFQGLRNFGIGTHPVSIGLGDLNGDGKLDMAVGLAGGSVNFLLGKGDGSFSTGKKVDTSTSLNSVALADLNGDGKLDVIAANNQANTISILNGNGNGTFQAPVNYATGSQPWFVIAADLNKDGHPDVVTANVSGSDVSVFMNQGLGTFPVLPGSAVGNEPDGLAKADLNGDGKLDMVTADRYTGTVSILLGNGNGTFRPALQFATGGEGQRVAVTDLNGDGKPDLVVTNWFNTGGNGSLAVLLGNGDGTFQAAQTYSAGVNPVGVDVGDFNGDGKTDVVVTDYYFNNGNFGDPPASNVSVLLGNGDGTLQPAQSFATGGGHPLAVVASDFNGDGKTDLAVANSAFGSVTSAVTLLVGNGDGTFQAPSVLLANASGASLAVGDMNGDGIADLVATTSLGVVEIASLGGGSFAPATTISPVLGGSLALADLNGDGRLDIVTDSGPTVVVVMNQGAGSFAKPIYYLVGANANALVVGDWNGDGLPDIAVSDSQFGGPGTVHILFNDGKPF